MDERLRLFKKIIRECSYDNTYKMALAKSLVEISMTEPAVQPSLVIEMEKLAKFYLKYYWNQTIFFDLVQGSNLRKIPAVLQYTKELIETYFETRGDRQPVRFERAELFLEQCCYDDYQKAIKKISRKLPDDVIWRFIRIDGRDCEELYTYQKNQKQITISGDMLTLLKDNHEDLFDLIDYRWGLILETFNSSPRINKKVKIIDGQEIKRSSLKKFRRYLDAENPERKCFICGKTIEESELGIDHVIPWSYLYSDDLWNLVYVHKSCNSEKTNRIPSEVMIVSLKQRNDRLLRLLRTSGVSDKNVDELDVAIEKDYVEKFWIGCK